jgi:hypothetical protein
MNRWIRLFVVAGEEGVFVAIGLAGAGRHILRNNSKAASQLVPNPEVCRNLRRELSIDIDDSLILKISRHNRDREFRTDRAISILARQYPTGASTGD